MEFAPQGPAAPVLWRVAVYIRLSRENRDGDRAESGSVTNQRKILEDWLGAHFGEPFELVDAYVDDGLTGTTDDRERFASMIRDIEGGRVNCVVTKSLTRAFRNYADQGYYLEQHFPLHGVRFISIGNPFVDTGVDPDAVTSGLEIPINGLMNDRYAAKTSLEVRRTFAMKRQRGEFIGSHAPYGYRKDPADKNHLLVDEEAAAVVREVFAWYVGEGMSIAGIALRLSEAGVPCPSQYKRLHGSTHNSTQKGAVGWHPRTVRHMLGNRVYVGDMVQGQQRVISYKVHKRVPTDRSQWCVVPGTHEPVVARAVFERAQDLLARRARAAPGQRRVHVFAGFLRCADCGGALTRRSSAKARVYYACKTYKEHRGCSPRSIREDRLEAAVLAAVRLQLALVEGLDGLVAGREQGPDSAAEAARALRLLERQQRELEQVKELRAGLYRDFKTGVLTGEEYRDMKGRFVRQKEVLEGQIRGLREQARAGEAARAAGAGCREEREVIPRLSRAVLTEFVEVVSLHAGGEIALSFRFADGWRRALRGEDETDAADG